jgi:hypothetical protein
LEAVLRSLVARGKAKGVGVPILPQGDKNRLLKEVPRRAARHLSQNPADWIFALPDLYPMSTYVGTQDAHSNQQELRRLLLGRFTDEANRVALPVPIRQHFKAHCLKHDLEVLLLAVPDILRQRLGTGNQLRGAWRRPVEDQNDQQPPKRIVEQLFTTYRRKKYVATVDALWILERAVLGDLEVGCPQCFGPFVDDLRAILQ